MKLFLAWILILSGAMIAGAQIASGGSYTLNKSVIAAGGGTSGDQSGALYSVTGTAGQFAAGTSASGGNYAVRSGFCAATSMAPTAADVSISGNVITPQDLGLTGALVTLTDARGNRRTARTGKFGSFIFREVAAGETYILTVSSKRYTYAPQIVSPMENLAGITFTPY